jgi:hypothetical protein
LIEPAGHDVNREKDRDVNRDVNRDVDRGVNRDVILAVERANEAAPDSVPLDRLAAHVARLSDLYTVDRHALAREQASPEHLAAKCGYFLASDAPKVVLALEEAAARSRAFAELASLDRVRVVDLGAGVGATTCGFIAWLAGRRARLGVRRPISVEIHAVELGAPAARALERSARAAALAAGVDLALVVEARDFRGYALPATDLILCQTALNELLPPDGADPAHRPETVAMVAGWAAHAPLLVIEPALRTTTRALMALRDALLAAGAAHAVAPCLHQKPCPMRAKPDDWCHEARRVEPTPRVAAIDRIVGRRDGRALFAYLATVPTAAASQPLVPETSIRIVTDPLGSRGKTERVVCRADGELRLMRLLDREQRPGNALFVESQRGLAATVNPMPANDRIGPEVAVTPLPEAT